MAQNLSVRETPQGLRSRAAWAIKQRAAETERYGNRFNQRVLCQDYINKVLSAHGMPPVSYESFRQMVTGTQPWRTDVRELAETFLQVPPDFLSGKGEAKTEPSMEQLSTILTRLMRGRTREMVRVFRGGSSDVWVMSPSQTEEVEVRFIPGDEQEFVRIADGSLRGYYAPSVIVVFEPHAEMDLDVMLLVCNKAEPSQCAIRLFDPAAGTTGGFVDPHGQFPPLPIEEWRVKGIGTMQFVPRGLPLKKSS